MPSRACLRVTRFLGGRPRRPGLPLQEVIADSPSESLSVVPELDSSLFEFIADAALDLNGRSVRHKGKRLLSVDDHTLFCPISRCISECDFAKGPNNT